MPELPEVETIRRELEVTLVGKTLSTPVFYFPKMVKTPLEEYRKEATGRVCSVSRKGKCLILNLDNRNRILFHLRMEGKLYLVRKDTLDTKHLSLFFPFVDDPNGLAFYDVRKFGVTYLLHEQEEGPLADIGPEPSEIEDATWLFQEYRKRHKPIKELLMDQSIMSGIGNIYADEILFASSISPFRNSESLTQNEVSRLLAESKRILSDAINANGSTIRTYHVTPDKLGSFQDFLKIYGKEGMTCPNCRNRIEKRFLSGRGTCYCPHCQHTGISIGITGKIASGKSLASSYFEKQGFVRFSCDEEVHRMYQDERFLRELKKEFPEVFNKRLSKKKITHLLQTSPSFRKRYDSYLFREVRRRVNQFLTEHDGEDKIVEVPLLFDAKMEHDFTYLVGTETTRQSEHLQERGETVSRKNFNLLNSYDRHRNELDFILTTDGTKEELFKKVEQLAKQIRKGK